MRVYVGGQKNGKYRDQAFFRCRAVALLPGTDFVHSLVPSTVSARARYYGKVRGQEEKMVF